MVRQVNTNQEATARQRDGRRRPWWAALLILIAAGGVIWHILACTESPMAFSPDGKSLAFVTLEPYESEKVELAGTHAYRLMVLADRKNLRTIEQSTDAILSAPAYSPDGSQMAYLRIPLITAEKLAQEKEAAADRAKHWEAVTMAPAPITGGPDQAAAAEQASAAWASVEDLTLPDVEHTHEFIKNSVVHAPVLATMVVRSTKDDSVVQSRPFVIHGLEYKDESILPTYVTIRPQYSPDGEWVYFCAGGIVMGVSPGTGAHRLLATNAAVNALAPDGQTMAVLQADGVLGMIRTDGQTANYRRWKGQAPSLSGLAWVDNHTLAVLCFDRGADRLEMRLVQSDGSMVGGRPITLPSAGGDNNTGELAIAPDGKHMVAAYGDTVHFMDGAGKIVSTWKAKEGGDGEASQAILGQPTFSPDSNVIAFKVMAEKKPDYARTYAIVFFTTDGKEISRADVPKAAIPIPKPAGEPAPAR